MDTPKTHIHDRSLSLLVTVAELSKLYVVWGYDNLYKLNWRMKTSSSLKKLSNIWKRKYKRCGFYIGKKTYLMFHEYIIMHFDPHFTLVFNFPQKIAFVLN